MSDRAQQWRVIRADGFVESYHDLAVEANEASAELSQKNPDMLFFVAIPSVWATPSAPRMEGFDDYRGEDVPPVDDENYADDDCAKPGCPRGARADDLFCSDDCRDDVAQRELEMRAS